MLKKWFLTFMKPSEADMEAVIPTEGNDKSTPAGCRNPKASEFQTGISLEQFLRDCVFTFMPVPSCANCGASADLKGD
jgi:hypothetical protein